MLAGVPHVGHLAAMAAIEAALGLPADPIRRLGALAVLIPEDAERLWQKLRLANVEHERLASMGESWWRLAASMKETDARVLLYRLGPECYRDRILLAWARSGALANDAAWRNLATLPQRWMAPAFPLKAADLMDRGLGKGPALGAALRAAEEAWIARGFPCDVSTISVIADEAARSAANSTRG